MHLRQVHPGAPLPPGLKPHGYTPRGFYNTGGYFGGSSQTVRNFSMTDQSFLYLNQLRVASKLSMLIIILVTNRTCDLVARSVAGISSSTKDNEKDNEKFP